MYVNKIRDKKGVELVWWTMMAIILAIIVLLIFVYFIRSGSLQIEGLTDKIFGAPEHFANTT